MGIGNDEQTQPFYVTDGGVFFCTEPEPVASPTEVPEWYRSITQPVEIKKQPPSHKQQVVDPYDQLLSMILDSPLSNEYGGVIQLPQEKPIPTMLSNESQSHVQLEAEIHSPITLADESQSNVMLEAEFHRPLTMEPLLWDTQSKTLSREQTESYRLQTVKAVGFSELFIEEEEDANEEKGRMEEGENKQMAAEIGVVTSDHSEGLSEVECVV